MNREEILLEELALGVISEDEFNYRMDNLRRVGRALDGIYELMDRPATTTEARRARQAEMRSTMRLLGHDEKEREYDGC